MDGALKFLVILAFGTLFLFCAWALYSGEWGLGIIGLFMWGMCLFSANALVIDGMKHGLYRPPSR